MIVVNIVFLTFNEVVMPSGMIEVFVDGDDDAGVPVLRSHPGNCVVCLDSLYFYQTPTRLSSGFAGSRSAPASFRPTIALEGAVKATFSRKLLLPVM